MVGVEWLSQFEVHAHYPMARKAGVSEAMSRLLHVSSSGLCALSVRSTRWEATAARQVGHCFLMESAILTHSSQKR